MRLFRAAVLTAIALAIPAAGFAQSSQFGVRALGLPSFPFSIRAQGSGGAGGTFDPGSAVNPASLFLITRPLASINIIHGWRTTENPYGKSEGNDSQFPLFLAGGRINARLSGAVSASVYADRTFALSSRDTVDLRGVPTETFDTLVSKGGMNDIRLAGVYRGKGFAFGAGIHLITGTNRLSHRRVFSDSAYARVESRGELSFAGLGFSAGIIVEPNRNLLLGASARVDGDVSMQIDSLQLGSLPLPMAFTGSLQWTPSGRLSVGGHVISQTWGRLDGPIKERDGTGAASTLTIGAGFEVGRSAQSMDKFPLRMGVRWASLPFPLEDGQDQGSELGLNAGTGFAFGGGRGVIDIAVERIWRKQDPGYSEKAFAVKLGVTIRQ